MFTGNALCLRRSIVNFLSLFAENTYLNQRSVLGYPQVNTLTEVCIQITVLLGNPAFSESRILQFFVKEQITISIIVNQTVTGDEDASMTTHLLGITKLQLKIMGHNNLQVIARVWALSYVIPKIDTHLQSRTFQILIFSRFHTQLSRPKV